MSFGGVDQRVEQAAAPAYQLISLEDARVKRDAFKTLLPLYSLKAAAGYFGSGEAVEPEGMGGRFVRRQAGRGNVCSADRRSFDQPRIPDGSLCAFGWTAGVEAGGRLSWFSIGAFRIRRRAGRLR